jgi:hypothetical protein
MKPREPEIKESEAEENDWNALSMQSLEKAYDINEPDYKDVPVQEANSDYQNN